MRKDLKNGVLVGFLIVLVIFVLLPWTFSWYQERNEQRNTAVTPASEMTQEEYNAMYLKSATDGRTEAIESIGDPAFSAYVFGVLDKRCPFYEPDGAGYRECLWSVVSEKEAAYKKGSPTSKEIDDECQVLASNLGGLVAGEVVLSCRAYKLSQ